MRALAFAMSGILASCQCAQLPEIAPACPDAQVCPADAGTFDGGSGGGVGGGGNAGGGNAGGGNAGGGSGGGAASSLWAIGFGDARSAGVFGNDIGVQPNGGFVVTGNVRGTVVFGDAGASSVPGER